MSNVLRWVCALFCAVGISGADAADLKNANTHAVWRLPVFVSRDTLAADRAQADRLAVILGQSKAGVTATNPVCCFWVEIDGFKPNPGQTGYVVVFQPGGCVVRASNTEQLERAVTAIQSAGKIIDGKMALPINGLLTSYPVL